MLFQFKSIIVAVLAFSAITVSCGEKNATNHQPIERLVHEVSSSNFQLKDIQIDNLARTITIGLPKGESLSAVELEFVIGNGIEMVFPSTSKAIFNLSQPNQYIIVRQKNSEHRYRIKVKYYVPVFDPTAKGWESANNFGELPEYVSVFKYTKQIRNKEVKAYIATANMNNSKARFAILGEKQGYKTPSQFYSSSSEPKVVLNGGYFWSGYSIGLLVKNSQTLVYTQPVVTRKFDGKDAVYYPTQGAFGMNADGTFSAYWTYHHDAANFFAYDQPAPIKLNEAPKPYPSAVYPSKGIAWKPKEAIGAGPLLIKGGKIENRWEAEMFDAASGVQPEANHPRSAIGYLPSGYLILFVCEGRNLTPNTPGLTTQDVAELMHGIGCTEALNLDGGGSSMMLINGKEVIKPSDGKQRTVTNAVSVY